MASTALLIAAKPAPPCGTLSRTTARPIETARPMPTCRPDTARRSSLMTQAIASNATTPKADCSVCMIPTRCPRRRSYRRDDPPQKPRGSLASARPRWQHGAPLLPQPDVSTMARIRFEFAALALEAELLDTPTARLVAAALPIESRVMTWGEEVYFD